MSCKQKRNVCCHQLFRFWTVTTVTVDKYKFLLPGLSSHVCVWKAVASDPADLSENSECVGDGRVSFLVGRGSDMPAVAASWKKKEKERDTFASNQDEVTVLSLFTDLSLFLPQQPKPDNI